MIGSIIGDISGFMYSKLLIIMLLAVGLYFTVKCGFLQIRMFGESVKVVGEKPDKEGSVSSFQALMVSTASRVGTGNIVGVSTAICLGGFGSVFKQDLPQAMFTKSVSDFFATRARCMVTSCATCAAAYKSSGMLRCFHYLELIFGCEMDMDAYNDVFGELWDPANPRNFEIIDSDEPFFK